MRLPLSVVELAEAATDSAERRERLNFAVQWPFFLNIEGRVMAEPGPTLNEQSRPSVIDPRWAEVV
jgi:hypothetical protein